MNKIERKVRLETAYDIIAKVHSDLCHNIADTSREEINELLDITQQLNRFIANMGKADTNTTFEKNKDNGWIDVSVDGVADVMPTKDCDIWIARCGMGEGWIQKVKYSVKEGCIGWDGTHAYQIASDEEPKPYIKQYANGKTVVCKNVLSNIK